MAIHLKCGLVVFLMLYSPDWANAQWKRDWVRHFGQSSVSEGRSIVALPDGNFVVAGYAIRPRSSRADAWLIKIDGEGKRLWERPCGGKGWDEFHYLALAQNGDLLAVGQTDSNSAGKSDAWLVRLNQAGEILWEKTYGSKRWEEAQAVASTKDNGALLATTFNPKGENDDIRIIKVDENGNELWHFDFSKGKKRENAHSLIELPNREIMFTGFCTHEKTEEDGFLVKLSAKGELIWEKNYGKEAMDALHDVEVLPNGELLIVGFGSVKNKSADLRLLKLDTAGRVIKQVVQGGAKFDKGRSLALLKDGNIAITGLTASEGMGKSDTWTLVFNQDLELLWKESFGGEGRDIGKSVATTQSGEILVAGKIDFLTLSTFLVIKYIPDFAELEK